MSVSSVAARHGQFRAPKAAPGFSCPRKARRSVSRQMVRFSKCRRWAESPSLYATSIKCTEPRGSTTAPSCSVKAPVASLAFRKTAACHRRSLNRRADEHSHRWPQPVHGTDWILYAVSSSSVDFGIEAVSLTTGERKKVIDDATRPFYTPSRHLVFERRQDVFAGAVRPGAARAAGRRTKGRRARVPVHRIGERGTFLYDRDNFENFVASLVETSRTGEVLRHLTDDPLAYPRTIRLSPDGRTLLGLADGANFDGDLWMYDLEGRPPRPLHYTGHNLRPRVLTGWNQSRVHLDQRRTAEPLRDRHRWKLEHADAHFRKYRHPTSVGVDARRVHDPLWRTRD